MASQSSLPEKHGQLGTDTPCSVNDDAKSGRFLQDKELRDEGPTASKGDTSPYTPQRRFNYLRFHKITLILAIAITLLIVAVILISVLIGDPKGYATPRSVKDAVFGALLWAIVTIIWATANLLSHRYRRKLLSLGLGTAIHGVAGMWSSSAGFSGIDGALPGNESVCMFADQRPGDEAMERCMEYAGRFHILLFIYLALLFIFGLVHILLFVASFTATYRSMSFRRESESGFRIPAGPLSFEFTFKVLRQDSAQPGPIQPASRVGPESGGRLD